MREQLITIQKMLTESIGINPEALTEEAWKKIVKYRMKMTEINSLSEYLTLAQTNSAEFQQLIEEVVVPETWFFRERDSFEYLAYQLKNKTLTQDRPCMYRILSLPCSSGEEPYSVVMAFDNVGISRDTYEVHGIDISMEALEKAQRGVYKKNSFRGSYQDFQDVYFTKVPEGYKINPEIAKKVLFSFGNIMSPNLTVSVVPYDAVFCRNLFIYLVEEAQLRIFTLLEKLLKPDGVLIVAPAEIELARKYGYTPIQFPKAFAFKKGPETSNIIKMKQKRPQEVYIQKPLATKKQPPPDIIEKTPKKITEEEIVILAKRHADEGQFSEAEQICIEFIENRGVNPTVYFLMGLIQHAQGKENRAEDFFLKTIYLDPKHYEALIYLALLSEKNGNSHKAELYRRRAEKTINPQEDNGERHAKKR